MKRALQYLARLLRWIAEPRVAWLTILVTMIALFLALRTGATEKQIRITGALLQLFGVVTVAIGVKQTRKLFDRPGILAQTQAWLKRAPRWKGRTIALTGTGSLSLSGGGTARLDVWSQLDPKAPLDLQVAALTRNTLQLKNSLNELRGKVDSHHREQSEALHIEQANRSKEDSALRDRLESAQTGGLHLTAAGVIWLLFGVLLGTLSPEIAAL